MTAIAVQAVGMSMRFGALNALQNVSLSVAPGTVHALLGENGAGKSTLVKCMMGFYRPDDGQLMVDGREVSVNNPVDAQRFGLGMVYQHFTLAPSLSGTENLLIGRHDLPGRINRAGEQRVIDQFMQSMPLQVDLKRPVSQLSAGEKQKLEIIKQLYLGRRFLILDEPTPVLTPAEADEVLALVRDLAHARRITVLMITHKFREVMAYADQVSVLRRGELVGDSAVNKVSSDQLAQWMVGASIVDPGMGAAAPGAKGSNTASPVLSIEALQARNRHGLNTIRIDGLSVRAGQILGIAGVSGNGQTELMEILIGARAIQHGSVTVNGESWRATRGQARKHRVRVVPEEPLHNACAPAMTVAQNLVFRDFDLDVADEQPGDDVTGSRSDDPENRRLFWLRPGQMRRRALERIRAFSIKTQSADSPIQTLSGGNVQRAVLARELTGHVNLLLIANPCFGLDFNAAAEVRSRLIAARNAGAAVLLISEDLDEILLLSDRVAVMSGGSLAFQADRDQADRTRIGQVMAGQA